jgi:sigma-E factor negative regulatory protein RseC
MLLETGRVVAVETDGVWVETVRQTTCGSCAAQKGCGHGMMNRISEGRRSLVRALPGKVQPADCAVDDEVSISIPEEVILRGSLVVYILPLLAMLLGAWVGASMLPLTEDAAGGLGAVCGFALGIALVRWHALRHRNDSALQPVLMAVVRHKTDQLSVI